MKILAAVLFCLATLHGNLVFEIIDHNTLHKDEVIRELQVLQHSFSQEGSFLVPLSTDYMHQLLKKGLIIAAYDNGALAGYACLNAMTAFKELYESETVGHLDTHLTQDHLDSFISKPQVGYIEQVVVNPSFHRAGIGSKLIEMSKQLKPAGLIADVFLEPSYNEVSLRFFSRQGFEKMGILTQSPREDYPYPHRTQVFFWTLK